MNKLLQKCLRATAILLALACVIAAAGRAGVVEEEYAERQFHVCEPHLLERRAAEAYPAAARFLSALQNNSVYLLSKSSFCSGTFITNNCVLTAAHCLNTLPKGSKLEAGRNGQRLTGGVPYFDQDYGTGGGKTVERGKISGDDVGVVVFKKGYDGFKPMPLSSVLGNLNLWFNSATKMDALYTGGLAKFEHDYWRNLGALGLTGYTSEVTDGDVGICSDSAFDWSPCLTYRTANEPPTFEKGVVCVTGEFGPGMSGGSFYNQSSLFGILIEGPNDNEPGVKTVKNHWWKSYPKAGYSSNGYVGVANRVKILTQHDREFISKLCPGAQFAPLQTSKGPAVKDPALFRAKAANQFWLSGGTDVWRKLRPADRWSRINVPLSKGSTGEFVVRLQRRLLELNIGVNDSGVYDEATTSAVRKFQKAKRLPETGQADQKTITKMGIWFNQRN